MFPSTGEKYSRWYQVPAETERFVWLARDHTLYPGSWSKWKLPLNKITSGNVQQAIQWTWNFHCHWQQNWVWLQSVKGESLVHDCFSHISTEEHARHYSETRSRSNVSGTYTCRKTLIELTFSMERLYWLTEGWYRNISLLPVPRTNSLNSLVEALITVISGRVAVVMALIGNVENMNAQDISPLAWILALLLHCTRWMSLEVCLFSSWTQLTVIWWVMRNLWFLGHIFFFLNAKCICPAVRYRLAEVENFCTSPLGLWIWKSTSW